MIMSCFFCATYFQLNSSKNNAAVNFYEKAVGLFSNSLTNMIDILKRITMRLFK